MNSLNLRTVLSVYTFVICCNFLTAGETLGYLEENYNGSHDDSLRIELLLQMGDHFEHTDFEAALHFYKQALELSHNLQKKGEATHPLNVIEELGIKSLRYIAILHMSWQNYDDASIIYQTLKEKYLLRDDYALVVRVYISLGNIHWFQSGYTQALDYYNQALSLAESKDLEQHMGPIYLSIANIHYQTGYYSESISYYHQALSHNSKSPDSHTEAAIFTGLANIYGDTGNKELALENYHKALDRLDELAQYNATATVYLNMGAMFYESGEYEKARKYYEKSINAAEIANDSRIIAQNLLNIGLIYARNENFNQAISQYNRAMEYAQKSENRHIRLYILRNMAVALHHTKNYNQARDLVMESLQLAEEINSLYDKTLGHKVLAEIEESTENFSSALNHQKRHKTLSDSLLGIEKQKELARLDAKYHFDKQQQQLEIKSLELEKNQVLLKQRSNLLTIITFAFLLLVIASLTRFFYRRHTQKIDVQIRKKDRIIEENRTRLAAMNIESQKHREQIHILLKKIKHQNENLQIAESIALHSKEILLKDRPAFEEVFPKGFMTTMHNHTKHSALCWLHRDGEVVVMAIANCKLSGVAKEFVKLFTLSQLEIFSRNGVIHKPEKMAVLLEEKLDQLSSQTHLNEIYSQQREFGILIIDKSRQRVSFSGHHIPLYIAISRNPVIAGKAAGSDYKEIQQLSGNPIAMTEQSQGNTPTAEYQLKKSDRLYFICNNTLEDEKPITDELIISLLDNNQDIKIDLQDEIIWKGLRDIADIDKHPRDITILGFEL